MAADAHGIPTRANPELRVQALREPLPVPGRRPGPIPAKLADAAQDRPLARHSLAERDDDTRERHRGDGENRCKAHDQLAHR